MSSENSRPQPDGHDGGPLNQGGWAGIELLWELDGKSESHRRNTALGREQIVRAAIAIADAEGLEAVTMRRVAQRLNTGAMSLYRHVPDKDALVSMMIETILGDEMAGQPQLLATDDWRTALRGLAQATWQLSRKHRWYPEASIAQPPLSPNGVAGLEQALAVFDPYDLDIMTRMQYVGAVHHLALHAALDRFIEEEAARRLGVTEEEAFRRAAPVMEKLMATGRYPHVTEFITAIQHLQGDEEDWILASVDLILDGIESRLSALGGTGQDQPG
jgi:AcrR family transcriptional regulator